MRMLSDRECLKHSFQGLVTYEASSVGPVFTSRMLQMLQAETVFDVNLEFIFPVYSER